MATTNLKHILYVNNSYFDYFDNNYNKQVTFLFKNQFLQIFFSYSSSTQEVTTRRPTLKWGEGWG
jgi:hypothetical protein